MTRSNGRETGRSGDREPAVKRGDGGAGRHLGLGVGALLVVCVFAAVGWLAVDRLDLGSHVTGSGVDRAREWLLDWRKADLEPVGSGHGPSAFVVYEGEGLSQVAERLAAEGFVRDAGAFLLLARVRGLDRSVQAGRHELDPAMSAGEVLLALQQAPAETVVVTVLEGLRAEETAALLSGSAVVETAGFLEAVTSAGRTGRPIVDQRPSGSGLEGYLFPDTYEFDPDSSAETALGRLLDNFEQRFEPLTEGESPSGLSVHEIVTLASIVEREAVLASERPMIARVFLNRLAEPPYLLDADPTVQYALGYQESDASWWKRPLTTLDLEVDSPYNSYTHAGLPPGPIASPGLDSLKAVVVPADGDWQFFVADDRACDGSHLFAVTYEEHLANVTAARSGDCGG